MVYPYEFLRGLYFTWHCKLKEMTCYCVFGFRHKGINTVEPFHGNQLDIYG